MCFSPFSIAITSHGEEKANISAFRTFVRFALVWICRFPLPLGVREGLRFVIVHSLDFSLTVFWHVLLFVFLISMQSETNHMIDNRTNHIVYLILGIDEKIFSTFILSLPQEKGSC